MKDFTRDEIKILKGLKTPRRIQDFLDTLPKNFDDTLRSPRRVLRDRTCHCIEGALLAAAALELQGQRPLLLDLRAVPHDLDHVVALYQRHGHWGAISKTNHAVLRYREPVYRTIRELALSYFHEYFLDDGRKTLREFSRPFDLLRCSRKDWRVADDDLWDVATELDDSPHASILNRKQLAGLRRADRIEIAAGKIKEWPPRAKKKSRS